MNWKRAVRSAGIIAMGLGFASMAGAAVNKTFTIQEPFGLEWPADRVDYVVEFPKGGVAPDGVSLKDASGNPVAVQLSNVELWPDGKTVKKATVSFIAGLKPDERAAWMLTGDRQPVQQPGTDLKAEEKGGCFELTTDRVGIRVAAGEKRFEEPVAVEKIPAPLQGVRLLNKSWIGKGWWTADRPCTGYKCELLDKGPVMARVKLEYTFTDDTRYGAIVELSAGGEVALVKEEFNLSNGRAYEMPEQPGEDKTVKYRYVLPTFDNPGGAMLWDWWGGSQGRVTAPNGYLFSFHQGLAPDSLEFYGRMVHKAAEPGDGGLTYAEDQSVISINAFMNWGEDECVAAGLYNSKDNGAGEVVIMGLRPGQWINPDLDPHPIKTLKQFTQTGNLWLEKAKAPDIRLRVPTCLGKRIYGIGVLSRQPGKDVNGLEAVVSGLLAKTRFLGRTRVDDVKDWVLEYDEPAKYPRLLTKPGDVAALIQRTKNNAIVNDNFHRSLIYLTDPKPETARKMIEIVMKEVPQLAADMMGVGPQSDSQYYMAVQKWASEVDLALGLAECSPAEAKQLRRRIAAYAYMTRSKDVHPGRENGYGWGAINMPSQWRQATALLACLVPNHPRSPEWREAMVNYFNAEVQVRSNPAGAGAEVGAYGGIDLFNAAIAMGVIQRADPKTDLGSILDRMRAVAHFRLQQLAPPDVRGGFRPPCPIGDSPYATENSLGYLWFLFEQADPRVASNLAWGIREGKVRPESGLFPAGLCFDIDAPASMPDLKSERLAGAGFILRSGFPDPGETYININAGGFSFGHGHPDRGCYILYAKGAPLMTDFGPQYQPLMRLTWNHAGGITFDNDESIRKRGGKAGKDSYFHGKSGGPETYEIEPFTCLQPGIDPRLATFEETFLKDVGFVSRPAADYAVADQKIAYLDRVPYMISDVHGQQWLSELSTGDPVFVRRPFTLTRRYVLVKSPDPAGPNYMVARDTMPENTDHKPALNLWCLAEALEVKGPLATFTGQHGVDLDVYVAEPAAFQHVTHKVGHTNGRDFKAHYEKTFGKPFKEEQILFQIPQQPGGGFFTALVPRKHGEPLPRFETVLDGKAIRVTFADGRIDTVVMMEKPGEVDVEGRKLAGTAFVVTRAAAGAVTVTELAK